MERRTGFFYSHARSFSDVFGRHSESSFIITIWKIFFGFCIWLGEEWRLVSSFSDSTRRVVFVFLLPFRQDFAFLKCPFSSQSKHSIICYIATRTFLPTWAGFGRIFSALGDRFLLKVSNFLSRISSGSLFRLCSAAWGFVSMFRLFHLYITWRCSFSLSSNSYQVVETPLIFQCMFADFISGCTNDDVI